MTIDGLISECNTNNECINKINELNVQFDNNNYQGAIQLINDITSNQYFSNDTNFNNYINQKTFELHNNNKNKIKSLINFLHQANEGNNSDFNNNYELLSNYEKIMNDSELRKEQELENKISFINKYMYIIVKIIFIIILFIICYILLNVNISFSLKNILTIFNSEKIKEKIDNIKDKVVNIKENTKSFINEVKKKGNTNNLNKNMNNKNTNNKNMNNKSRNNKSKNNKNINKTNN